MTVKDEVMEMPLIHCDEDWLDLDEGEKGMLKGKLEAVIQPQRPTHVLIRTAGWDIIAVSITEPHPLDDSLSGIAVGSQVSMVIERDEDGPFTRADNIEKTETSI